ncbi:MULTISPECIES: CGGC domain-containing protein [unclassified Clostridium]|uniref:CGGC domain-containing protein n=1 Tax=unclassified Clostridium TaxID=2614128 RepID=UPI000297DA90|nr:MULTISPECIES: CGGC domain-containing protein [unclassified Clostridium]EKQ55912.1 MAG: putative metal-binding protein [Clostridium sp. Maddingley MBC34-26]
MDKKYVVIIQCDIAHNRCSGFACTNAFYNRDAVFSNYDDSTRYISFTCGGCCGKSIAAKLEHLSKKLKTKNNINKDEVVIHLSSCISNDNYHYDRCPHIDYIKSIISKKGYTNLVEGSYISSGAERKRNEGTYNCYDRG